MPEVNIQEALGSVRKLGVLMRALAQVTAVLDDIGDLDQAARDAEVRCGKARADFAALTIKVAAAGTQLRAAQGEKEAVVEAADELVDKAKAGAGNVLNEAREKASAIVQVANESVAAARDAFASEREKQVVTLGSLREEELDLHKRVKALKTELEAIKARL